MDHITLALNRARQSGHATWGRGASAATPQHSTWLPAPIRYSATRQVQVSAEHLRGQRIVAGPVRSEYAESYRILRTRILQEMRARNWNTLAITSPGPGEGKSLTAMNLALSLAMDVNQTVLLVEADLRAPCLHSRFGFIGERGLSDFLQGEAVLSELLVHPAIERLVLLPGGAPMPSSAELLASGRMAMLFAELKHRYVDRIVLVDLPDLLHTADALSFLPQVDGVLLVVEEGRTHTDEVARAMALLEDVPILGAVLNKSPAQPARKGPGAPA